MKESNSEASRRPGAPARAARRFKWTKRIALAAALLVLGVFAVRSSLARPYVVGGASDAPTLLIGDRVWINLAAYDLRVPFAGWRVASPSEPQRGDLVLCHVPGRSLPFVKRIVACGGDTIALRDNRLMINDEAAAYEPLDSARFRPMSATNRMGDRFAFERLGGRAHMISYNERGSKFSDFGPLTVPRGSYFILGDNRDNSYDSRAPGCGCLSRSAIVGRMIGAGRPCP
jgi:signal peptidase I